MDNKKVFEKYYRRLAGEGVFKALLFGFAIAFALYCALVVVMWATHADWLIWVAVAAAVAAGAGSSCLLYFKRFRPTTAAIARRIDALGLEERMITMAELQSSSDFIAMRQREDAVAAMHRSNPKLLKFSVPVLGIVLAAVTFCGGTSVTVVTVLAEQEIISNPIDSIVDAVNGPDTYYTISYQVFTYDPNDEGEDEIAYAGGVITGTLGWGGMIEGSEEQLLLDGETAEPVLAVADDELGFVGWSDGYSDPAREDVLDIAALLEQGANISVNEYGELTVTYYAVFSEIALGEGEGEGGEAEESEEEPDAPPDTPSEAEPEEGEDTDEEQEGEMPNMGDGSGGRYEDYNQIIDADTYYRDRYQEYYEQAQELMASGEEIPDALREFIEAYYGIII